MTPPSPDALRAVADAIDALDPEENGLSFALVASLVEAYPVDVAERDRWIDACDTDAPYALKAVALLLRLTALRAAQAAREPALPYADGSRCRCTADILNQPHTDWCRECHERDEIADLVLAFLAGDK